MIKNPNKHNKENMTEVDRLQLGDLVWLPESQINWRVSGLNQLGGNQLGQHQSVSEMQFVLCTITYIPPNLGEIWRLWGNGQEYLEYYWNMCRVYNLLLMERVDGLSMLGLSSDYWRPMFERRAFKLQEIGMSSPDE